MIWLAVLLVVVGIAYCMIDGRNVTIRHLKQDLARRDTSIDDLGRERDTHKIESGRLRLQVKNLQDKLEEKDARVEKIVVENSHVQWKRELRDREAYTVAITVNPRMFGGYGSRMERDDLLYIARHIGDQVAYELASYKYIQKANEDEWRHRDPRSFVPNRNPGPITPDTQF